MADDFKKKLQSISFPRKLGATEHRPVINEDDGTIGGHHDVRWDGSQDATVNLKRFVGNGKTQGDPQ